jgi:membrane-associated protein
MSLLTGVHGTAALALLLSLLFAEEAGVPLPLAPGEVSLVATGLLVASGAVSLVIALPLVWIACGTGAWLGFSWSRRLGRPGLTALAARIGAQAPLRRASDRLSTAGPLTIGVSRSIPGLRIYTTLVAGASGVRPRSFLAGALPAMAAWATLWLLLGATVGIPASHVFSDVSRLALRAAVLLAIGTLGVVAARRIPPVPADDEPAAAFAPRPGRIVLAVAIDLGIVATLVAGLGAAARTLLGATTDLGWIELAVIFLLVGVGYLGAARRAVGATAGESLLTVSYVRHAGRPPTS